MPNIHDVAREAGVSIATVSRVMNGDSSVHPALRHVVEAAVRRTGYRPNAAARSLRMAKSNTVGVIVAEMLNPPFTSIVHGIAVAAAERGVSMFLSDAGGSFALQAAHLERLHERRVDGVIIHPIGPYHSQVATLREDGIPVVIMGQRAPSGGFTEIVVDEDAASVAAIRHLIAVGHRRILFLPRRWDVPSNPGFATHQSRLSIYRQVLAEFGIPVEERLIIPTSGGRVTYERVRQMLAEAERPAAVICGIHSDAPEVLLAARELGLRVPEDLSLVTYGDSRWAEAGNPPINVVANAYDEYGRRAADLLFSLIGGASGPVVQHHPARYVARGSVVSPRSAQGHAAAK